MLTINVPHGKSEGNICLIHIDKRYRATPPAMEPKPTKRIFCSMFAFFLQKYVICIIFDATLCGNFHLTNVI